MKRLEILLKKYFYNPGETIEGVVVLRIDKPLTVREMTLQLEGVENTQIEVRKGSGDSAYTVTYTETNLIIFESEYLTPTMEIPAGEYSREFSFQLPSNATLTYGGTNAWVTYLFKAHANVPMWFDLKTQTSFWVVYSPRLIQTMSKPIMTTTDNFEYSHSKSNPEKSVSGEKKPKPSFMVVLDKNTFMAGETINGRIFVRNPSKKKIRKVKVRLFAEECATAKGHRRYTEVESHKHKLKMADIPIDTPSNFSIPIPRKVSSCFYGVYSHLNWYLEFQLDIAFAYDVKKSLPIAIYQWHDG